MHCLSFLEAWCSKPRCQRAWFSLWSVGEGLLQASLGFIAGRPRVPVAFSLLPIVCSLWAARSVVSGSLQPHMDYSPPGSSVPGILQARILQWVAISSSRGSSRPRDGACFFCLSCIGRQILYCWVTWKPSLYMYLRPDSKDLEYKDTSQIGLGSTLMTSF